MWERKDEDGDGERRSEWPGDKMRKLEIQNLSRSCRLLNHSSHHAIFANQRKICESCQTLHGVQNIRLVTAS